MPLRKRTKKWVDGYNFNFNYGVSHQFKVCGVAMGWTGCSLMDNEPVIKRHERIKLGVE